MYVHCRHIGDANRFAMLMFHKCILTWIVQIYTQHTDDRNLFCVIFFQLVQIRYMNSTSTFFLFWCVHSSLWLPFLRTILKKKIIWWIVYSLKFVHSKSHVRQKGQTVMVPLLLLMMMWLLLIVYIWFALSLFRIMMNFHFRKTKPFALTPRQKKRK